MIVMLVGVGKGFFSTIQTVESSWNVRHMVEGREKWNEKETRLIKNYNIFYSIHCNSELLFFVVPVLYEHTTAEEQWKTITFNKKIKHNSKYVLIGVCDFSTVISMVHYYWQNDNVIYLCALPHYDVVHQVASDIRSLSSSCSYCCRPCSYYCHPCSCCFRPYSCDGSCPCSSVIMALQTFAGPSFFHALRPLEPSTVDCCPPGWHCLGRLSLLGPLPVYWTCERVYLINRFYI